MTQQQFCWEHPRDCYPYPDPSYPTPGYADFAGLPPSLFMALLIGLVTWVVWPRKKPPIETDEEKLFKAIGQYEGKRRNQADGRRTQFVYRFKDPCLDECPKSDDEEKKAS